jgi:hypothetical protein
VRQGHIVLLGCTIRCDVAGESICRPGDLDSSIASRLVSGIVTAAVIAGVECLEGMVLANNKPMLSLAQTLGFVVSRIEDDSTVMRVTKKLRGGEC